MDELEPAETVRVEREDSAGAESEGTMDAERVVRERARGRALETEDISSWVITEGSILSVAADNFLALAELDEFVRRVCVISAAFAEELLGFAFGDAREEGVDFLTLTVADLTISLVSRLVLFPCGSLAGESTFLPLAAFDKSACLGVPLFNGALWMGVAVAAALRRVARARRGEGVDLEAGVPASFLTSDLGVPFPLASSSGLLSFFWSVCQTSERLKCAYTNLDRQSINGVARFAHDD